jgi:hypothetical protein
VGQISVVLKEYAGHGGQHHEEAVNNMAYSTEQCGILAKRFYQTNSVIMIQRKFRVKLECRKAPRRPAISRLVKKSEATGGAIENRKDIYQ